MLKPLITLIFAAVLILAGSTTAAQSGNDSMFGLNPACASTFGVAAKGLWIFGTPLESEALKISDTGTSARFAALEAKLLNVDSRNAFMRLLDFEKGRSLVINFLLKTGVVKAEHTDPYYPMLILASENVAVDLRKEHHDPTVDKYLKASNFSKKAELDGVEPILQPRSRESAKLFFYWEVLKALDIVRDSDTRSRDVVVAVFTEVGRARDRSMGNEATYLAQVEVVLDSVIARASYIRRAFGLPTIITSFVAEIPFGDPILQSILMLYSKVFERNRELRTQDLDPASPHPGYEMVDGSFRLLFTNRDVLKLKDVTNLFYANFCERSGANVFSPQFADALEAAYPELQLVRHKKGIISNHSERDMYFPDSQFGPVTFEGYKIIYRAALFISILRGDAKAFSDLSATQFQALRRNMIAELGLTYSGPVREMRGRFDRDKIDMYMTFFFMDALGKGKDAFLEALDSEHQITKTVGADYERRAKKFFGKI